MSLPNDMRYHTTTKPIAEKSVLFAAAALLLLVITLGVMENRDREDALHNCNDLSVNKEGK